MFEIFAVGCVITSVLTLLAVGRLWSPALLIVATAMPVLAGLSISQSGVNHLRWVVPAFLLAFSIGIAFQASRDWRRPGGGSDSAGMGSVIPSRAAWASVVAIVVVLSLMHFQSAGIASLSGNAEIARFDLDSGYLGIPSRAVIFGLPILTLAVSMRAARLPRALVIATWAAFVLSRAALGFKSGILEVLIIAFTVVMCRRRRLTFNASVALVAVFIAALVYANWIGAKYGTISGEILSPSYLADRLGRQSAQAVTGGLELSAARGHGSFLLNDLQYFMQKYSGTGVSPGLFPIDQIVSANITGAPLSRTSFIVPVTVGGPAYVFGSIPVFPSVGTLAIAFYFGRGWEMACTTLSRASSELTILLAATAVVGIRSFVLSGGGVYLIVNCAAVFLLLYAPHFLAGRTRQSEGVLR